MPTTFVPTAEDIAIVEAMTPEEKAEAEAFIIRTQHPMDCVHYETADEPTRLYLLSGYMQAKARTAREQDGDE